MEIRDVDADGNCFFRALYNAAKDHYLLQEVADCYQTSAISSCWDEIRTEPDSASVIIDGLPDDHLKSNPQEDAFVRCLREHIATRITYEQDNYAVGMYNYWRGLDEDTKIVIKDSLPTWLYTALETSQDKNEFRGLIASSIRKMGSWVDEPQVKLIVGLLQKCTDIKIQLVAWDTESKTKEQLIQELTNVPNRVIVLICKDSTHYNYLYNPSNLTGGKRVRRASSQKRRKTSKKRTSAKARPSCKA